MLNFVKSDEKYEDIVSGIVGQSFQRMITHHESILNGFFRKDAQTLSWFLKPHKPMKYLQAQITNYDHSNSLVKSENIHIYSICEYLTGKVWKEFMLYLWSFDKESWLSEC